MRNSTHVLIPRQLFDSITHALNMIPNQRRVGKRGESSYDLASALGKEAKPLELDFIPDAAKDDWDDIEVHPVVYVDDDNVEVTEDESRADFWSVYLHQAQGGVQCIADLPTKEQADNLAALIHAAIMYHTPNK